MSVAPGRERNGGRGRKEAIFLYSQKKRKEEWGGERRSKIEAIFPGRKAEKNGEISRKFLLGEIQLRASFFLGGVEKGGGCQIVPSVSSCTYEKKERGGEIVPNPFTQMLQEKALFLSCQAS